MTPDTHYLNKICAEVCGKDIESRDRITDTGVVKFCVYWATFPDGLRSLQTWDPCMDHNQMAEVKTALREKGYHYCSQWTKKKFHRVSIYKDADTGSFLDDYQDHEYELIAFALAVEATKKGER